MIYITASDCASNCASNCAYIVHNYSDFRDAVCAPPIESCGSTTMISENNCSSGYIKCTGSKSDSDAAGDYTIACSE
ncbi:MAG: hypothetical protein LBL21_00295 [Rickettsiales bacterium]|nr:hypothetical protein [Rickettsiales bacterium]